jgi:CheY-like chemotaxis protein
MAAKVLEEHGSGEHDPGEHDSGEHDSGATNLNLNREIKLALEERAPLSPPNILSAAVGLTMPGEPIPGTAFAEPAPWGGPEVILLVEDEGFVRKATSEVLESAGYKLLIARSGAEALDAYRLLSPRIDLLLSDVVMPGMSGCDLASEFKSFCPHARVLMMSGYAEQLARCQVSPYCDTYLVKPFSMRMLLRKVREVLNTNPCDRGALA